MTFMRIAVLDCPGRSTKRLMVVLALSLALAGTDACLAAETAQQTATADEAAVFVPGDAIRIIVFPDSAFPSGEYKIDAKGQVDLPIRGKLTVVGKTVEQVEERLEKDYIDYLRNPDVEVRPLVRVALLGGFAQPGLYYISPEQSMWDALRLGGGPQRDDGLHKMVWERGGKALSRDIIADFESGKPLKEIGFKSGDQLRVTSLPKRDRWEVFSRTILPMLNVSLTTISSALTLYLTVEALNRNSKP